jgi:hypothetical protein
MKNCKTYPGYSEEAAKMGDKQFKERQAGKKPSGPKAAKALVKGNQTNAIKKKK